MRVTTPRRNQNARYQLSNDLKSVELRVPSKIEDNMTSEDEIKITYGVENLERAFFVRIRRRGRDEHDFTVRLERRRRHENVHELLRFETVTENRSVRFGKC